MISATFLALGAATDGDRSSTATVRTTATTTVAATILLTPAALISPPPSFSLQPHSIAVKVGPVERFHKLDRYTRLPPRHTRDQHEWGTGRNPKQRCLLSVGGNGLDRLLRGEQPDSAILEQRV